MINTLDNLKFNIYSLQKDRKSTIKLKFSQKVAVCNLTLWDFFYTFHFAEQLVYNLL